MFTPRANNLPGSILTRRSQTFALRRNRVEFTWLVIWLAIALSLPQWLDRFHLHLVNLSLLAAMGAIPLNLLTGNARLVSLGQAAFLAVGGFTAGILANEYGFPFLAVLPMAAVFGGILGLLVALPSLRLKALYVAVTTLALHYLTTVVLGIVQAQVLQSSGMGIPVAEIFSVRLLRPAEWFYFLFVASGAFMLAALNLLRSNFGRVWMAVADHDIAAETLGIRVGRAKVTVFVISSAMVSIAGAVGAYYIGTVTYEFYNLPLAIMYLAMIIVGGLGSIRGSVIGAFTITLLPYIIDGLMKVLGIGLDGGSLNGMHSILYGALIIAFLLFEPRGINELWRRVRVFFAQFPFRYESTQREGG